MSELVAEATAAVANVAIEGEQPKGPSKAELKKLAKKAEKEAKKAEYKAKEAAEKGISAPGTSSSKESGDAESDALAHLYGDAPLICSKTMTDRVFKNIEDLSVEKDADTVIWMRARVHTSRAVSKGVFLLLRQQVHTIQAIAWQGAEVPKALIKYAASLPLESVIDVRCKVVKANEEVQSATQKQLELQVLEIHSITKAEPLPFLVEDAGRNEEYAQANQLPTVSQDTALNYRWIDTRTPANQAIFRIQSGVCMLFREFLLKNKFIEIHTPKLIGGASEGGSNVFKLDYFDQKACLAQSPQLYKQMAAACGGFDRVFEIGPVFRAENSNTHRHLCEFTGLDLEMAIHEHYYEVLDMMGNLFIHIFDGLNEHFQHEMKMISQQYPFEPLVYSRPTLRLTYKEGIDMLIEAGYEASHDDDISTTNEKALGKLVKAKYNTDFYIMDKYPLAVRPFYTMPDPENPTTISNSYDFFIRGEEIVSGAQRIHDVELLQKRAKEHGIPLETIQSYLDAFKHGALPHGGGGIGMERVVMLFLGLKNVRKASMFPRDPSRLAP